MKASEFYTKSLEVFSSIQQSLKAQVQAAELTNSRLQELRRDEGRFAETMKALSAKLDELNIAIRQNGQRNAAPHPTFSNPDPMAPKSTRDFRKKVSTCKGCQDDIAWKHEDGRWKPLNLDGTLHQCRGRW